jgi:hypothetical protein
LLDGFDMDIFFQDPNEVRLPPEEVRLRELQVTPQPDGNRVKIYLELTPFKKRPNVEVTITAASGKEAAHASILEAMLHKMEFTMHLRQPVAGSRYNVQTIVYYQRLPEPSETPTELPLPEPMIVDCHETTFTLPKLES